MQHYYLACNDIISSTTQPRLQGATAVFIQNRFRYKDYRIEYLRTENDGFSSHRNKY